MASSDPRIRNNLSVNTPTTDSSKRRGDFTVPLNLQRDTNINQTIKNYKDNNSGAPTLRFPLTTPKYYMTLDISKYSRQSLEKISFSRDKTIVLPMPMPGQMIDANVVDYGEVSAGEILGAIGNQAGNFFQGSQASSQNLGDLQKTLDDGKQAVKDIIGDAATLGKKNIATSIEKGIAKAVATNAGKVGLAAFAGKNNDSAIDHINAQAQAYLGYAPNQWFTVLLKGPKYNTYQFSWIFLPKNFKESKAIQEIYWALSNAKAVGRAPAALIWEFPNVFKLTYHPNSKFLNRFKPSVINSVSINWAQGAPSFYAGKDGDNPPEAVIIQASFVELEYWVSGDYGAVDNGR